MTTLLLLALVSVPVRALAKTPYEAKIAGFIYASLQAVIIGEFAGRSPSQVDAPLNRPVCKPSDYDDLRAAARDRAAFDAFRRRCRLVETKVDSTHVHGTAYLPRGYCETLKNAFNKVLAEQVYIAPTDMSGDIVIFEYKGSRFLGSGRALARSARLQSSCQDDGSLQVRAPRNPR